MVVQVEGRRCRRMVKMAKNDQSIGQHVHFKYVYTHTPVKEHLILTNIPSMAHLSIQPTKIPTLMKPATKPKDTATIALMKPINLLDVDFVHRALVSATKDTKEQVAVHDVNYVLIL